VVITKQSENTLARKSVDEWAGFGTGEAQRRCSATSATLYHFDTTRGSGSRFLWLVHYCCPFPMLLLALSLCHVFVLLVIVLVLGMIGASSEADPPPMWGSLLSPRSPHPAGLCVGSAGSEVVRVPSRSDATKRPNADGAA
jgi:hypothetical protein